MKFSLAASIALVSLVLAAVPASAQQAPPARADIGLQDIPEEQIDAYVGKSNAVVELLNISLRASESWRRYLSWADVKRGPTGKERIIYGLYSVSEPRRRTRSRRRGSAPAASRRSPRSTARPRSWRPPSRRCFRS